MDNSIIPIIVLMIMFVAVVISWSIMWKWKEYYRNRVFELTDGKEGSNLVNVKPSTPSPKPPIKKDCVAVGRLRPLRAEWVECYGEYFRKSYVVHLTKNPNGTINVVLVDGHSINTGMDIDEVKDVLGEYYMPNIKEELSKPETLFRRYSRD